KLRPLVVIVFGDRDVGGLRIFGATRVDGFRMAFRPAIQQEPPQGSQGDTDRGKNGGNESERLALRIFFGRTMNGDPEKGDDDAKEPAGDQKWGDLWGAPVHHMLRCRRSIGNWFVFCGGCRIRLVVKSTLSSSLLSMTC